jgi:hypothetical protein
MPTVEAADHRPDAVPAITSIGTELLGALSPPMGAPPRAPPPPTARAIDGRPGATCFGGASGGGFPGRSA